METYYQKNKEKTRLQNRLKMFLRRCYRGRAVIEPHIFDEADYKYINKNNNGRNKIKS